MAKLDTFKYIVTIEEKETTRVFELTTLFEEGDNNSRVIKKTRSLLDEIASNKNSNFDDGDDDSDDDDS